MPKKPIRAFRYRARKRGKHYKAWCVYVPKSLSASGKGERKFFATQAEAEREAEAYENARLRHGAASAFLALQESEQVKLMAALHKLGAADLVLRAAEAHLEAAPNGRLSLLDLMEKVIESKEKGGKSAKHTKQMRLVLGKFVFGRQSKACHAVTGEEIEQWLNAGTTEDGKPWSANTKISYLRKLRAMFSYAVRHKYARENPCLAIEPPSADDTPVAIFTPEQVKQFMRAAVKADAEQPRDGKVGGYLPPEVWEPGRLAWYFAVGFFAGIRPDEIKRLTADSFRDGSIVVEGKKTRSRNRRIVPINATLKAWLDKFPQPEKWSYRVPRFRWAVRLSKLKWTQDVMRHSFISHQLPLSSKADVARWCGNSEDIIDKHYRELVTKEQAEEYWKLTPDEVLKDL